MNVLKTIFYIIIFYYAFKFLMRLLLPVVVQKTADHIQDTLRNQSRQYQQQQHQAAQEPPKQKYPRETKKVGEYVDFEEIE